MTPIRRLLVTALAIAAAACGAGGTDLERSAPVVVAAGAASTVSPTTPSGTGTVPATPAAPTTTAPAPTTPAPTTTAAQDVAPTTTLSTDQRADRVVVDTGFSVFAVAEEVAVHHPAAQIERIGFHESGHDGARQMGATAEAARPVTLASRDRGTGSQTAADIVVPPDTEIRVPVTGVVKRAGGYILYCDTEDDFAVIEPDARPGWEVKVFHIDGVLVRAGDRVEAGITVLAPRATILPFASQVDEFTAEPSWPHVHVEIVDPSIPDRPGTTSDC